MSTIAGASGGGGGEASGGVSAASSHAAIHGTSASTRIRKRRVFMAAPRSEESGRDEDQLAGREVVVAGPERKLILAWLRDHGERQTLAARCRGEAGSTRAKAEIERAGDRRARTRRYPLDDQDCTGTIRVELDRVDC